MKEKRSVDWIGGLNKKMASNKRFDGKVVLITGSTRGIGLAIAKAFSNEGALIGLNGRDQQVVEETRKKIPNSISATGDVSKVSGCEKAVQSVLYAYGRLEDRKSTRLNSSH